MHAGVQGEGRPAADGVAFLVFVGDERDRRGGEGSGDSAGIARTVARQGGCDSRRRNQTIGRGRDGRAQAATTGERGVAAGERDLDDGVGFFAAGLDPTRR